MTDTTPITNNNEQKMSDSTNYHKLNYDQINRLDQIIGSSFDVHGLGGYPNMNIRAKDLIVAVRDKLLISGFKLEDIRVNGGVALTIVGGDKCQIYNDLDILFNLRPDQEPGSNPQYDRARYDKLRWCILETLIEFLPKENLIHSLINIENLADAYVQKWARVQNGQNDLWGLLGLRNTKGRNIELKFVDRMKRKFEFSIDSFQLIIDDYLTCKDLFSDATMMKPKIFPTVPVESMYGDYEAAKKHLENKLIVTRNPEEIRGGGLLKYCLLKSCGYQDEDPEQMPQLKKYMCSRFFIDFPDVNKQQHQLENYLMNHFNGREELKNPFLVHVLTSVQYHAMCLPMREKMRTLGMINDMALQFAFPAAVNKLHTDDTSALTTFKYLSGNQLEHHRYQQMQQQQQQHFPPIVNCSLFYATPIMPTPTIS